MSSLPSCSGSSKIQRRDPEVLRKVVNSSPGLPPEGEELFIVESGSFDCKREGLFEHSHPCQPPRHPRGPAPNLVTNTGVPPIQNNVVLRHRLPVERQLVCHEAFLSAQPGGALLPVWERSNLPPRPVRNGVRNRGAPPADPPLEIANHGRPKAKALKAVEQNVRAGASAEHCATGSSEFFYRSQAGEA